MRSQNPRQRVSMLRRSVSEEIFSGLEANQALKESPESQGAVKEPFKAHQHKSLHIKAHRR